MNLTTLFDEAKERKASDIHLATGEVPRLRIDGSLVRLDQPAMDSDSLTRFLEPILSADARSRIESGETVERAMNQNDLSYAGIFFRAGDEGMVATFRVLGKVGQDHDRISEGAEALLDQIIEAQRGLVIMSGPTMSGKWTSVASVVERINARRPSRIFVIEAHPSFSFDSKEGLVTKLHVGQDCESYARALQNCHQADLDVVAIDDIPTIEALREILILAETGHLVIATLHAQSVVDVIQRLVYSVGQEAPALLRSLSQNLFAITSQRLFQRIDMPGRVPAYSYLMGTTSVQHALQSGDLATVAKIQREEPEHRSGDAALDQLIAAGKITDEMAAPHRTGN